MSFIFHIDAPLIAVSESYSYFFAFCFPPLRSQTFPLIEAPLQLSPLAIRRVCRQVRHLPIFLSVNHFWNISPHFLPEFETESAVGIHETARNCVEVSSGFMFIHLIPDIIPYHLSFCCHYPHSSPCSNRKNPKHRKKMGGRRRRGRCDEVSFSAFQTSY